MRKHSAPGFTLVELMMGMTIMTVVCLAFASLLRMVTKSTVSVQSQGWAQEETRQALVSIERALVHVNEVRVASAAFVEFVADLDHASDYNPDGDSDGDGIPNFRDADRDNDAGLLYPATAQWRIGFNLLDDDEDADERVDVVRRLYLSSQTLWLDTSVNEAAWGTDLKKLASNVSTFTLSYFGNKANSLGSAIDLGNDGTAATSDTGENDGIITSREMDMVLASAGMGNRSGGLDLKNERRYITSIRLKMGMDRNQDGKTDYEVETDVYPPLLPLKSR